MKDGSLTEAKRPLRHLQSAFSHRVNLEDVAANYRSAQHAYDCGDYLVAARFPGASRALHASALAFGGLVARAVEIFDGLSDLNPQERIAYAFALWSIKREDRARDVLDTIPPDATEHKLASALRELLSATEIPVFIVAAHIPVFTTAEDDSLKPSFRRGQFLVKHVGSQLSENAYSLRPSDPFDEFVESLARSERPLFLYAATPQWFLPARFAETQLPKIMWAHDSDFFLHRNAERYRAFDKIIVSTSQEHHELSRALGVSCHSNLFSDPLLRMPNPDQPPCHDKPIDVLFTGSAVGGILVEKAQFIYELAGLANEFQIVVVEGHLPDSEYGKLLAKAKFLPIVNRYYGNPSPRWRDALSSFTYVLYPAGVPYEELCRGFFPFDHRSIERDVRAHLRGFQDQTRDSPYQMEGVFADIARHFPEVANPRAQQFERNLKLCAYLALAQRHTDHRAREDAATRNVWLTPQIDCLMFGREHITAKIAERLDTASTTNAQGAVAVNDLASLHAQIAAVYHDDRGKIVRHATEAVRILEGGIQAFPSSLVLRYNAAHWKFMFELCSPEQSVAEFKQLISDFDDLEFSPLEDDLGLGMAGCTTDRAFPTYDYGQLLTLQATHRTTDALPENTLELTRTILKSALHGFVGWAIAKGDDPASALTWFRMALELYGDNLPLTQLKLETLLRLLEQANRYDAGLVDEALAAFLAAANRNPAMLTTHGPRVFRLLRDVGNAEQLSALLEDWYRYSRVFRKADSAGALEVDPSITAPILEYRRYFPAELQRDSSFWRVLRSWWTGSWDFGATLGLELQRRKHAPWLRFIRFAKYPSGKRGN